MKASLRFRLTAFFGLLVGVIPYAHGMDEQFDFKTIYPATLDSSPNFTAYEWVCEKQDVWKLTEFAFTVGDKLRVETGPATVVFGHHQKNALWAAVFPDHPGLLAKADAGKGERVTSIWLRFHPALVDQIFPSASVEGQGDPAAIDRAKRLAHHKLTSSYQSGGQPFIPGKGEGTVDLETKEGIRRFFAITTADPQAEYIEAFERRPLRVAKQIDHATAVKVFDTIWEAFDREYAMFVVKPDVDWQKLRDQFRPQVDNVSDDDGLARLISKMLSHLEDLHVSMQIGEEDVPVFQRPRPLNANFKAIPKLVGPLTDEGPNFARGVTEDGIGYLLVSGLTDNDLPRQFDDVIAQMKDTRGLIIDLRFNGGGSEPLGNEIAGVFLDREQAYAKSQFRNGPKHSDLDGPHERRVAPRDPWHYVAPVIVLQGRCTMSSAESFVMMLSKAPQVKTMGDRTAGSSGNPRLLDAGAGITVRLPRWNDLDTDGKSIDVIGVPPAILIKTDDASFDKQQDPVLKAALDRLRTAEKFEGPALKLRPGAKSPAERPRVISVSPSNGATDVNPNFDIRIRFDRPMDPGTFHITWLNTNPAPEHTAGFQRTGLVKYVADRNEFVFPVRLSPDTDHRLQVITDDRFHPASAFQFFRSKDGVATSSFEWKFRTGAPSSEDTDLKLSNAVDVSSLKDDANRAKTLLELIRKIRQRRRDLKSVVERIDDRTDWSKQPTWHTDLRPENFAHFWWQGTARFRAEGDNFFFNGTALRVGGNNQECWCLIADHFVVGPSESISKKHVQIADAFLAGSDWTDEKVIAEWKLDYLGEEQFRGSSCHRIRSHREIIYTPEPLLKTRYRDWLIDAKTLLPVVCEDFGNASQRFEFTYEKIDEELPDEIFQPPKLEGIIRRELDPLDDTYDHHFLNSLDGSSGNISIRWGKRGPGATSSSGLN